LELAEIGEYLELVEAVILKMKAIHVAIQLLEDCKF